MSQYPDSEGGWTFIETLIVIAIILILSTSVGFMAFRYIDRAKEVSARSQIETYALALDSYYMDMGSYPTADQGLSVLWQKPSDSSAEGVPAGMGWRGPYINKPVGPDPWGRPYEYSCPGVSGLPYGIRSLGADGREGGEGANADISSWEK